MKILFIGDYSGFHASFAIELRRRGHDITIVSDGSGCMSTTRDIDITRGPGKLGGIRYLYKLFSVLPQLKGFDIVQIIAPIFLNLRPGKNVWFFRQLRQNNGSIFLSLAGNDSHYVEACVRGNLLRYSEFRIGIAPTRYAIENQSAEREWLTPVMRDYCRYIYDNVEGAVSCLYEYHIAAESEFGEKLGYTGIPIDLSNIPITIPRLDGKINIFTGIKEGREIFKGTDRLLSAVRKAEKIAPQLIHTEIVKNLPYQEYLKRMSDSHIVLDQLYSYTPAKNALEAMALGKTVVSGAEPEYYNFIGEDSLHPIINAVPGEEDTLATTLATLAKNPEELSKHAIDGRAFVEKHNSVKIVTDRLLAHWKKILSH